MKPTLVVAALTLATSLPAAALDAACEPYVKAAEKSAAAPRRHTVTELDAETRVEAIKIDGVAYMKMDENWMKAPPAVISAEQKLTAELRGGQIKLWDCKKLGRETVEGIATTVYSYRMEMPGMPKLAGEPPRVFVGDDGLIHAQSADGAKVRYRYTGVTAPKL